MHFGFGVQNADVVSFISTFYIYIYIFYIIVYFIFKTRYPAQEPTNSKGPITLPTCGGPFKAKVFLALYGLAH
jgi:hypothetical protein